MENKNAGGGGEKGKRRRGEAEERKGKQAGGVESDNPALSRTMGTSEGLGSWSWAGCSSCQLARLHPLRQTTPGPCIPASINPEARGTFCRDALVSQP